MSDPLLRNKIVWLIGDKSAAQPYTEALEKSGATVIQRDAVDWSAERAHRAVIESTYDMNPLPDAVVLINPNMPSLESFANSSVVEFASDMANRVKIPTIILDQNRPEIKDWVKGFTEKYGISWQDSREEQPEDLPASVYVSMTKVSDLRKEKDRGDRRF